MVFPRLLLWSGISVINGQVLSDVAKGHDQHVNKRYYEHTDSSVMHSTPKSLAQSHNTGKEVSHGKGNPNLNPKESLDPKESRMSVYCSSAVKCHIKIDGTSIRGFAPTLWDMKDIREDLEKELAKVSEKTKVILSEGNQAGSQALVSEGGQAIQELILPEGPIPRQTSADNLVYIDIDIGEISLKEERLPLDEDDINPSAENIISPIFTQYLMLPVYLHHRLNAKNGVVPDKEYTTTKHETKPMKHETKMFGNSIINDVGVSTRILGFDSDIGQSTTIGQTSNTGNIVHSYGEDDPVEEDVEFRINRIRFDFNRESEAIEIFKKMSNEGQVSREVSRQTQLKLSQTVEKLLEHGGPFSLKEREIPLKDRPAVAVWALLIANIAEKIVVNTEELPAFSIKRYFRLPHMLRKKTKHWIHDVLEGTIPARPKRQHLDPFYDSRAFMWVEISAIVVFLTVLLVIYVYFRVYMRMDTARTVVTLPYDAGTSAGNSAGELLQRELTAIVDHEEGLEKDME